MAFQQVHRRRQHSRTEVLSTGNRSGSQLCRWLLGAHLGSNRGGRDRTSPCHKPEPGQRTRSARRRSPQTPVPLAFGPEAKKELREIVEEIFFWRLGTKRIRRLLVKSLPRSKRSGQRPSRLRRALVTPSTSCARSGACGPFASWAASNVSL